MRRSIVGVCMALSLAVIAAAPAGAATTTVKGTGSYKKLVVNNDTKALIFKIHGSRRGVRHQVPQHQVP
jgi:hypothetical protein